MRDAARIGLGALLEDACAEALAELARRAAAAGGLPIVRLQVSRDAAGRIHLVGSARPEGRDPAAWRAVLASTPHPGPAPWGGAKVTNRLALALAADEAARAGADEAILLDRAGRLVEGARTALVVHTRDGSLVTPLLARGGVESLARAHLHRRVTELREADLDAGDLRAAREIVAVNAVRGARPVTQLDGRPVGDGVPGATAQRLARTLEPD